LFLHQSKDGRLYPNKTVFAGNFIALFFQKKTAAEGHKILVETYGDHALSERTCREGFQRFKNNDYDLSDDDRSGAPKKFDDEDLKKILDEDPCQTQQELAESLGVDRTTVS
jgi:histone-lysine N-methyltransferase SETMAR